MGVKKAWGLVAGAFVAVLCVLLAAGAAYWRAVNTVPYYAPPSVVMPVPNGFDDFVAAGQLSKSVNYDRIDTRFQGGQLVPVVPAPRVKNATDEGAPLASLREVVKRNGPALARLRKGLGKEYRNPPVLTINQVFPELADFRALGRVLLCEGRLAEREGRPNDAARSYLDCLRLGTLIGRGGCLIHGLVANAVQRIGLYGLEGVADRLDGPTAAAAAREVARLARARSTCADVLEMEKEAGTASIVDLLRTSPSWAQINAALGGGAAGTPGTLQDWPASLQYSFTPKRQMIEDYRAYLDASIAAARKPYYVPAASVPEPSDPLNRLLIPVFTDVRLRLVHTEAAFGSLQARLAARAYRLRQGGAPPDLAALVPEYLPAVPQDPFAPKPLVYRLKGHRVVVYSRGPDGDDDGGSPDLGQKVDASSNGDLVSLKKNFSNGNW